MTKIFGGLNKKKASRDKIPTMSTWHEDQLYIKTTLEELKSLSKDILARQQEHDKELDRVKWKSGFLSLVGGVLGGFGVKLNEWFHP